jgi:hypothetical protein
MSEFTRRDFVKTSAGAAISVTALGALGVAEADAKPHGRHQHSHQIVAWVSDSRKGKITVMSGKREVTIHDRKLVAKLAHAAK